MRKARLYVQLTAYFVVRWTGEEMPFFDNSLFTNGGSKFLPQVVEVSRGFAMKGLVLSSRFWKMITPLVVCRDTCGLLRHSALHRVQISIIMLQAFETRAIQTQTKNSRKISLKI